MSSDEFLIVNGAKHCSFVYCKKLDYLPLSCQSCKQPFCDEHFREIQHECTQFDPVSVDNRIPQCPLCSLPITFPRLSDPNIAMNNHLESNCKVLNSLPGSSKKLAKLPDGIFQKCHNKGCVVKMVVPMSCERCRNDYCAMHRFFEDHSCTGTERAQPAGTKFNWSKVGDSLPSIKPTPSPSNKTKLSNTASSTTPNIPPPLLQNLKNTIQEPIRTLKISKLAMQERKSQKKGLEIRAKKGLLNEREKLVYATLCAEEVESSRGGENGCVLC